MTVISPVRRLKKLDVDPNRNLTSIVTGQDSTRVHEIPRESTRFHEIPPQSSKDDPDDKDDPDPDDKDHLNSSFTYSSNNSTDVEFVDYNHPQ